MPPSESIGSRFVRSAKRFAQKHPVVSFMMAVLGVAFVALLLVLMVHRPFRYEGKSLGEWKAHLADKEFEGLAYDDWIGGKTYYQGHLQELFARSGDEGVLYLLGCAQFQESAVYAWLDKLPGNLRKLIPVQAPTVQKESRSRALTLLTRLDSPLLRHPRVLENLKTIALSREKDSNAAAYTWFAHHPDKQAALDVLLETYVDNDETQLLRPIFYRMKQDGIRYTLPENLASRWLKPGDDVNNFFNASFLYQYSSEYYPVFRDALSGYISNLQMKSVVVFPMATVMEMFDMEISASEKVELFEMVWREAESPMLKATAALGVAKMEGEDSPWWSEARDLVPDLPETCDFRTYPQFALVLQLFPESDVLKQRLETEIFQANNSLRLEEVYVLVKHGIRHQKLITALDSALMMNNGNIIKTLQALTHLEELTDTMRNGVERYCESEMLEVRRLALELRQQFATDQITGADVSSGEKVIDSSQTEGPPFGGF